MSTIVLIKAETKIKELLDFNFLNYPFRDYELCKFIDLLKKQGKEVFAISINLEDHNLEIFCSEA